MKIAFNPSTVAALTSPPKNKDITFDLRGRNIFARGVEFKGTDTNTWRDIKINNVSIGSNILDLRNGSNTTLTNSKGVVTINSTWRPVVDSLTSNSATSSLSANQGRVLKSLIDGKSDSGHNHDNRYLKLTGGTMLGALNFANNTWNKVGDDVYMGDHNIGGQLCIMGANSTTGLSFHKYGDASIRKSITFDGNTLYMNGSCDYATLSNQTNLLAMNTVPNKTAATSIGSWSPISGRYVFHQKWTDTSTGGDTADFGIYLDGNLTANMVLDGYYNSLLGFRVIGASGGFLKANGTIDNSTYLTSHQSLSNYYTKGEIDNQLGKYKLKSSIWVPETKVICSNFRDFLNKENLHKQAYEELNLYRFFAQGDESNYSSKYNYPVVDSHAMVFSIDGNNGYIRSMNFDLRSNNVYVTSRVANGEWRSWDRLLNTSDIAGLKNNITLHQYLSNTDTTWWPLVWGGSSHNNTSDSTGAVYKSHDKLSWQTSSQTLYATHLRTTNLDTQTAIFHPDNDSTLKIYSGRTQDAVSDGHIGLQTSIDNTDGQTHVYPTQYGSRCVLALQPRGGSVYIGNMPNGGNGRKLNVNGDIGLFNTGSIRDLAIGGGIYWNPNVESATDSTDAASITLVKSGVAGGTTLVLSQMNDASDTIQFKTNTAARLYHNSYPILTTQNTYVNNHKGYIYGAEITQVNNSDTVDGWHKDEINRTLFITSGTSGLSSYWAKLWEINLNNQYNDVTITFLAAASYYPSYFSIFSVYLRQNGSGTSKSINARLIELIGNIAVGDTELRLYVNNTTGNCQLWGNVKNQYGTMNLSVLKKAWRTDTDSSNIGTFFSTSFSSVQSLPGDGWYKVGVIQQGVVGAFNPDAHTHTWTSITDKIVAGNEFNIVNAGFNSELWFNYRPINDASKTATISQYVMGNGAKGIASIKAAGFIKNGGNENQLLRADGGVAGFNWAGQSGQPTWLWGGNNFNSYYVYNPSNFRVAYAASAGNAETLDGEHASSFVRAGAIEVGSPDLNALDTYSFIKSVNSQVAGHSPKGNIGWYNVIQAVHRNGAGDGPGYIGQIALGMTTNLSAMFYRTKYNGSWYAWNEVLTTNTGLLRYSRNNVNISSPNCSPIPPSLLEWTVGYPRLYDPEFIDGNNDVNVYNNAGNGVVTVTRVHDTNVGNSSSYVMKVVSASGASPNYGGWNVQTQTELGKVYTCLFRASIPSGVEIEFNTNSIGSGGGAAWLTNNMGTGKWTWYAMQVYCGSGGSTTFFFSAKSPCTWYLSYVNVIENNRASYAGLRSVYSDYLKQNASLVFGRSELQYFNQYTGVTSGAKNNANPTTDWYHILRMNHANNSGYFVDLAIPFNNNRIQFRRIVSGSDNGWRRVITEEPNHDVILREANTSGNVGIGINNPAYKLDVNGQIRASGFHHSSVNSDNYMLLAGGGYKSFGGDDSNPIFLGYLNLDHGNDGTISSSFSCLGYSVPFTYTRGGNYCRIYIPDTTHQVFYIKAATASVNYSGGGMDTWTGVHRGSGAWWLHCYAYGANEIRVKGFCQNNNNNDSWWGGNPLWSGNDGANKITVCIFGYVKFR